MEKVLELCSSMTCFTNCFTVSGSSPSAAKERRLVYFDAITMPF